MFWDYSLYADWSQPYYVLLHLHYEQDGSDYCSEESRRIQCTKCGNSHIWVCTNRSKAKARWCQVRNLFFPLILGVCYTLSTSLFYSTAYPFYAYLWRVIYWSSVLRIVVNITKQRMEMVGWNTKAPWSLIDLRR